MNLTLKVALFSAASIAVLGGSGCKVTECTQDLPDGGTTKKENCVQLEPTIEYRDANKRTGEAAWTAGRSITITNRNGPLVVAPGSPGDNRVQFAAIPFTRDTDNAEGEQRAKNKLAGMAPPTFAGGDNINLSAPGGGFDGYDLTVWIPANFGSSLTLVNNNGTTQLTGVDGTTTTNITSHSIIASRLRGSINLHSEVGDIQFDGIPSGAGNVVLADLGKIDATIGAANLTITAKAEAPRLVNFPSTWASNLSTDKASGSATLGDGSGTLSVTSGGGGDVNFFAQ
jgi:hypothetical protein